MVGESCGCKHHDLYIFSLSKTVHFKVLVFDSGYDSVEITFSYKKNICNVDSPLLQVNRDKKEKFVALQMAYKPI